MTAKYLAVTAIDLMRIAQTAYQLSKQFAGMQVSTIQQSLLAFQERRHVWQDKRIVMQGVNDGVNKGVHPAWAAQLTRQCHKSKTPDSI